MRHLISTMLLVAAAAAYATGMGPFFFGMPLLGSVMLLVGAGFEVACWRRLNRGLSASQPTAARH
jgi:hypothetical protein